MATTELSTWVVFVSEQSIRAWRFVNNVQGYCAWHAAVARVAAGPAALPPARAAGAAGRAALPLAPPPARLWP